MFLLCLIIVFVYKYNFLVWGCAANKETFRLAVKSKYLTLLRILISALHGSFTLITSLAAAAADDDDDDDCVNDDSDYFD